MEKTKLNQPNSPKREKMGQGVPRVARPRTGKSQVVQGKPPNQTKQDQKFILNQGSIEVGQVGQSDLTKFN